MRAPTVKSHAIVTPIKQQVNVFQIILKMPRKRLETVLPNILATHSLDPNPTKRRTSSLSAVY